MHRSRLDLEQRLHHEAEKEYNKDVAFNVIEIIKRVYIVQLVDQGQVNCFSNKASLYRPTIIKSWVALTSLTNE